MPPRDRYVGCRWTRTGDVDVASADVAFIGDVRVVEVQVGEPAVWSVPAFRVINPPELIPAADGPVKPKPGKPDGPGRPGPHGEAGDVVINPHGDVKLPDVNYRADDGAGFAEAVAAAGGVRIVRARR